MQANSWYIGANVPGKPREMLNFTAGMPAYLGELEACSGQGYAGFTFS